MVLVLAAMVKLAVAESIFEKVVAVKLGFQRSPMDRGEREREVVAVDLKAAVKLVVAKSVSKSRSSGRGPIEREKERFIISLVNVGS